MLDEVAILLSVALVATVGASLFSRSISVSLIMLFYSSLILGTIFASYGSIVVGMVHVITFAGAMSVMLLTVVLMTGESKLGIGSRRLALIISAAGLPVIAAAAYELLKSTFASPAQQVSGAATLFQFIWEFRPWDLLILIMVFASSMLVVVNLLSRTA